METSAEFKIMVVYENFADAIRAREISGRLTEELQLEGVIDCDYWRFELLGDDQLREQAASEAADATMVIIAAGTQRLPVHVRTWLDAWPAAEPESLSALVALINVPADDSIEPPPVCELLRQFATDRHMDFFCKAGDWWQFDLESLKPEFRLGRGGPLQDRRAGGNSQDFFFTNWGLND